MLFQNADMVCPEKKVRKENRKRRGGEEKRVNIIKLTLYKVLKVFSSMRGNSADEITEVIAIREHRGDSNVKLLNFLNF